MSKQIDATTYHYVLTLSVQLSASYAIATATQNGVFHVPTGAGATRTQLLEQAIQQTVRANDLPADAPRTVLY